MSCQSTCESTLLRPSFCPTDNTFTRTAAQILPPFLPTFATPAKANSADIDSPTASQAKMVDFALLLMPPPGSLLRAALERLLGDLPLDMKALSRSDYGPLRDFPAPVAIETKTSSGNMEEARVQLGIWTAAWFKRMRELSRHGDRVIAVPLLMVESEQWWLYYACEEDHGIVSTLLYPFLLPVRSFPFSLFYFLLLLPCFLLAYIRAR